MARKSSKVMTPRTVWASGAVMCLMLVVVSVGAVALRGAYSGGTGDDVEVSFSGHDIAVTCGALLGLIVVFAVTVLFVHRRTSTSFDVAYSTYVIPEAQVANVDGEVDEGPSLHDRLAESLRAESDE